MGYELQPIQLRLKKLLERFQLAIRMVGLEDLQGFHVIVDGQLCPIVRRVSMDQMHQLFAFLSLSTRNSSYAYG